MTKRQIENMDNLDKYNVIWKTPSEDYNGSMPIGNGDIGLNVWFEKSGDLLFYISKTDAWSENGRLLKLGRMRIKFTPELPVKRFTQTLRLQQGEIVIKTGEGSKALTIKVWVDANRPVIRVEANADSPFELEAILENWRTQKRQLVEEELSSAAGLMHADFPVYVEPDTIINDTQDNIIWYHRNERSIWEDNLKLQNLDKSVDSNSNPLLNRTFGACVHGTGLKNESSTTLKSATPQKHYLLSIYPLCAQSETPDEWLEQLEQVVNNDSTCNIEETRREHREWWQEFWNRSRIRVTGSADAEMLSRSYVLQRWINACAGRGEFPIKFNGSIFTVDGAEKNVIFDADYRRWGGGYWWQNTRLLYWPMLACGDLDLMKPLFKMYSNALSLAKKRTEKYYGHDGAFFPETMYFWGTYLDDNYGRDRTGMDDGYTKNDYIRYYWQGGLELSLLMLDFYAYAQDKTFAREILVPLASEILTFFDQHWGRDDKGKIRFDPAMALETYNKAINPLAEIIGIRKVAENMLVLPETITTRQQRNSWARLLEELPAVPVQSVDGEKLLAPAEIYDGKQNCENPELYGIFPYRKYGIGKPDLELARRSFAKRIHKDNSGWQQSGTQAALLGLTKLAADDIISRVKNKHEASRFSAFWGPNYDWIPDQCHGGNLMMTLQSMLLQTEGDKILLFPAWPKNWNVDFKLHAPQHTIIEGSMQNGTLQHLTVTPANRRKDIKIISWSEE